MQAETCSSSSGKAISPVPVADAVVPDVPKPQEQKKFVPLKVNESHG